MRVFTCIVVVFLALTALSAGAAGAGDLVLSGPAAAKAAEAYHPQAAKWCDIHPNFDECRGTGRTGRWVATVILGTGFMACAFADDYWSLRALERPGVGDVKHLLLDQGSIMTYSVEAAADTGFIALSHKFRSGSRWQRVAGWAAPILGAGVRAGFAAHARNVYKEPSVLGAPR